MKNTNRMAQGPCCPWCDQQLYAEHCDVDVGWIQIEGAYCHDCMSYEMGPYQVGGMLSEVEMATLWTSPIEDFAQYSPFNPDWWHNQRPLEWD